MAVSVKEESVVGFEDTTDPDENTKGKKKKGGNTKKSGGFQSMGLSFPVLKGIQKRGYKVPTPIQRKTIPLIQEGRDVVAMARTGSGKTACFLIPLFEKLKTHSTKSGIRALILSPTRELSLQTLRFTKELGKHTGLRASVILGGDSMESQFTSLHNSPDIIIATPGRFLHVCVEMDLKLNDIQYIVFDEADRLYEMGFGEQLREIIQRLPESRQTLLFSATLPKVLVEFARAGLSDPVLIRLDVDTKLPDTLSTHFISCRLDEKAAALFCLLKHVIKPDSQTIVFAATKHHVEYIHAMLNEAGVSNTYIYSDLDASARKINAAKFQMGKVSVMVVTDVAARGIDIPHLDNVINYNFPAKPKLFVHRVGRCARAGRAGSAYCLVSSDELCYVLDLHLFLGRPFSTEASSGDTAAFAKVPQHLLEVEHSQIIIWHGNNSDLESALRVSENAYKQYIRSRQGASSESVRRAKEVSLATLYDHPLFKDTAMATHSQVTASFIAGINSYRPQGTIFEIGQSSHSEMYTAMKKKREQHRNVIVSFQQKQQDKLKEKRAITNDKEESKLEACSSEDLGSTFKSVVLGKRKNPPSVNKENKAKKSCPIDKDNYIRYKPDDDHTEQGLGVHSAGVTLELGADTERGLKSAVTKKHWDKKKKKMVGASGDDKAKKIRSESGAWIPASFKSGRYNKWLEKSKITHQVQDTSAEDTQQPLKQQPNTHWGRHNLKVSQRKIDSDLRKPEQILKERLKLERKRKKHGRKQKKKKH